MVMLLVVVIPDSAFNTLQYEVVLLILNDLKSSSGWPKSDKAKLLIK